MPLLVTLTFLFLALTFASLWVKKTPKIWGSFLFLTIALAFGLHFISLFGLGLLALFFLLWIYYYHQSNFLIFLILIAFAIAYKLHLFSGYHSYSITSRFGLNVETPLIGLFPLALLVPLMKHWNEIPSFLLGLLVGIVGIGVLAFCAISLGAVSFDYKIPSLFALRASSNFFLVAIPEEGFYRGFVQRTLCRYLGNNKRGNFIALLLTSILFTFAHVYWSPSIDILIFVFLAGMLYGTVYLVSKRIESAICVHFLLNITHMMFFSYHAM